MSTVFHFSGITIIVPQQDPERPQLIAIDKGLIDSKVFTNQTGFTLIRQIANIVLYNKVEFDNHRLVKVEHFSPPIQIIVGYNFYDLMCSSCDFSNLRLAYWSVDRWEVISDDDTYRILPPSSAQVAQVSLSELIGDPPIAWGK
jgi:hypothetical protein